MKQIPLKIFFLGLLLLFGCRHSSGTDSFADSLVKKLQTSDDTEKVYIYTELSKYYLLSSLSESMRLALKAVALADSIQNIKARAEAYNRLGTIHYYFNNFEKATLYIIEGLKIRENIHDSAGIASSYTNLAVTYMANQDYHNAIKYNQKSIDLKTKLGITKNIGANYNNMSIYYWDKKDWTKALYWGIRTLEYDKKKNDKKLLAGAYLNIGGIYHAQKDYRRALKNYKRCLALANGARDTLKIISALDNVSMIYLDTRKTDLAYITLKQEGAMVKKYGKLDILTNYLINMAQYYKQKEDYYHACQYLRTYGRYNDTLFLQRAYDKISGLQTEFESQNMEYQIRSFKQNQTIKELTLKKEKLRVLEFIFFLLLILLVILIITYLFRKLYLYRKEIAFRNLSLQEANQKLFESEKSLLSLNQTKDKFFSIIAHDLINPFQPLLGLSELLITDLDNLSDDEIKKYATLIKESAMKLYNLLSNLLKWTQAQTGRLSYNPENIYLKELVTEILSFYKENAKIKNIHLMNHINKEVMAYADRELLSAIFRNLISNAIKFTNKNGYVKIDAYEKDRIVEVLVKDNGIGIDPERINKIFKIESAISTRGTEDEEGTGLGLILCKEFIEKNRGKIRVVSHKGKGTSFHFTLPKSPVKP